MGEQWGGGIVFDPQTAGDAPYLRPQPPEVFNLADGVGNGSVVYTPDGQHRDRLMAVSTLLTTDSTAANRLAILSFKDEDGIVFAAFPAPFVVVASKVARLTWAVGVSTSGAASAAAISGPIPPLVLEFGWTVAVTVDAGVAADTLTLGRVYRERWLTGPGRD